MSQARRKGLEIRTENDVTIVTFVDKEMLQSENVPATGQILEQVVQQNTVTRFLFNFSNIAFLSSTAIGMLVSLHKSMKAADQRLRLCSMKPEVYEVFTVMQLEKLFGIIDCEDRVLRDFQAQRRLG